MIYVCICMFLQKLAKLNYYWFIILIIIHIPALKKIHSTMFYTNCPSQFGFVPAESSFQPSTHRAPWDRAQVLEHLLPHIRHTQLTLTYPILWMLRAEEQLQESVLWVIPVFIVKCKWVPFNPMILMSAERPDRAYPKLSLACAVGI